MYAMGFEGNGLGKFTTIQWRIIIFLGDEVEEINP